MTKVSVIVPIYNSEKRINKCIDSIINQTYRNLEIILVNDGSIDKSEAICKEYANNDKRIKYIFQSNKGVSSARNNGVTNATGDYLLFVDSDDYIDLDMIEILINNASEECDLIIFGFKELYYTGNTELLLGSYASKESFICSVVDFVKIFGQLYELRLLSAPWNNLFSRKIIENHNIKFIEEVSYGEDTLFNLKYYNACTEVCILDKTFYNYLHSSGDSLSRKFNKDNYDTINFMYDEIRKLLLKHSMYHSCNKIIIERSYFYHIFKYIEGAIGNLNFKEIYTLCRNTVYNQVIEDASILLKHEKNISISTLSFFARNKMSRSIVLFLMLKTKIKRFKK